MYARDALSAGSLTGAGTVTFALVAVGYAIKLYAIRNTYVVNGVGEVGKDKLLNMISALFTTACIYLVLRAQLGLIALGVVFVANSLIYLGASHYLLRVFLPSVPKRAADRREVWSMFADGSGLLVLNVVALIVMNTDVFIVERLFGLEVLPKFVALLRLMNLVIAVALLIPQMTFPYVSMAWARTDFVTARRYYLLGVFSAVGLAMVLSALITVLGPHLIPLWLGPDSFLGIGVLGALMGFAVLYVHHAAHSSPVIATGTNFFTVPALVNAGLSLPLSIVGGLRFGVAGVVLGNALATLLPSVWVVARSYRHFSRAAHSSQLTSANAVNVGPA